MDLPEQVKHIYTVLIHCKLNFVLLIEDNASEFQMILAQ